MVDVTIGQDGWFVASKSMAINCSHVLTSRGGHQYDRATHYFLLHIQYNGSYPETGQVASTAFGPPEGLAGLLRSRQGGEG